MINLGDIFPFYKKESRKDIGRYECDAVDLSNAFVSLMDRIGASNPSSVVKSASKAVTIERRGDKFILTLNSFKPPIVVEWSGMFSYNQLGNILSQVADRRKKVAYINTTATDDAGLQFQLALG